MRRLGPRTLVEVRGSSQSQNSENQNRTGLRDGLGNALEERVVHRRMAAITRIRLVMDVLIRMVTADRCVIDIRHVELKHLGLAVINPDERVVSGYSWLAPQQLTGGVCNRTAHSVTMSIRTSIANPRKYAPRSHPYHLAAQRPPYRLRPSASRFKRLSAARDLKSPPSAPTKASGATTSLSRPRRWR